MTRRLERSRGRQIALSEALAELDRDIAAFITLSGFALDGMTRDHGWRFLSIGRRIERLQFLCGTLQQALAGPRRRRHRLGARTRRFERDLPLALHGAPGMAAGARPAGARPVQPALDRVPAEGAARFPRPHRGRLRRGHRGAARYGDDGAGGDRPRRRPAARQRAPRRAAGGAGTRPRSGSPSSSACASSRHVGEVNRQTFAM